MHAWIDCGYNQWVHESGFMGWLGGISMNAWVYGLVAIFKMHGRAYTLCWAKLGWVGLS